VGRGGEPRPADPQPGGAFRMVMPI
jgi:hypothetical protein